MPIFQKDLHDQIDARKDRANKERGPFDVSDESVQFMMEAAGMAYMVGEFDDALEIYELDRCILTATVLLVVGRDHILVEIGTNDRRTIAVYATYDVLLVTGAKVLKLQAGNARSETLEIELASVLHFLVAQHENRIRN